MTDRSARAGVSAAYAMQGLCFAGLLTQVPALQRRFAFSELALTLILLVVPLVAGAGSLLAGALAPRFGSGPVLRVAGPVVCACVAATGLAGSREALYAAVASFGVAVGVVDATMNMQGVAVQRRYRRSLLLSFHGWWSLAGIAGALANAGAARLHWPLAAALGLIAAAGAVVILAAGPFLVSTSPAGTGATGPAGEPSTRSPARPPWPPVVLIGLAVLVAYVAESSTANWSAVFLRDALHAGGAVAPLGLAAYLAAQLLGRTVADRAVGRFGAVPTVAAGGLISAAGLTLVATAPVPAVAIAGYAVLGAGLCVVVPLSFSAAGALDPTGVAIARVNLFNYAGVVVGAALVGLLAEGTTLRLAFAVPAALCLAIAALAPAFRRPPAPTTVEATAAPPA